MQLIINKKNTESAAQTVQELVTELGLPDRGVAVAIDNKMVPRAGWADTILHENDNITIIKAAFGG